MIDLSVFFCFFLLLVDTNSGFAGLQVLSAEPVNATAVRLQIVPESASSNISLESSLNRGLSWQTQSGRGLIATDLPPGKLVYLRVKNPAGRYSNPVEVLLPEQPLGYNFLLNIPISYFFWMDKEMIIQNDSNIISWFKFLFRL